MNIDIKRVIVIPRKYLQDYGTKGYCVRLRTSVALSLDLQDLDHVPKGYERKIEVFLIRPSANVRVNRSSLAMITWGRLQEFFYPDQLGLVLGETDGVKTLYLLNG